MQISVIMKFLLSALLVTMLSGCFGGVPSYEVRKKALTSKYHIYIEDKEERARVDAEWIRKNEGLEFGFLPHPYGDEALKGYGIEKVGNHKYSKY